jgi:hypothetical protein
MKLRILILSVILFLIPIAAFSADWVPMTSGTTNTLNGIWGSSASIVFAVGDGGTILHYDGSSWSSMTSGTANNLNGVWGSSASDVFVVGDGGTILHYNGSSWSSMASGTTYDLNAVWGASGSDVFAVGNMRTIIHFDGTAWSAMSPPCCYNFFGVWGSSGTDVYVTGFGGSVDTDHVCHYDGASWEITIYGANHPIWGSSSTDIYTAYIFKWHYNGNSWTILQPPSGTHYCYGIWGASAHDVFFAGTEGIITHYNGTGFSPMTSGTTNQLNCLWGSSSSDVFAVGAGGTILHYDGHAIATTTTTSLTTSTTTSIRPSTTSTVFSTTTVPATLVTLIDFHAVNGRSSVTLVWSTASEIDTVGYNLYRAESENGNFIKINNSLIPAQGTSTQGAHYEFIDRDVQNRKIYYYKLEDIDLIGTSTMHGPVSAMPKWIWGIFGK